MMTRRALSRQEEVKLQLALQELKTTKELCKQLTVEREDNEKILIDTLDSNRKLKSELSLLHSQLTCVIEDRDSLQNILDGFDQCGTEYEQALKRTSTLEKELCDAYQHITQLEEAAQCSATLKTQNLFDELISADRDHGRISYACCATQTVPIDLLIGEDSVRVCAACTRNTLSRKNLKKYVKINKYISKTKKMIKNQKGVINKIRNKRNKIEIVEQLQLCTLELDNNKLMYESDIQHLQNELYSVEACLKSITNRYEKSQEAMREYSLAMDELLQLSNDNKERYDSLVANHSCGCQCAETPEPVCASKLTSPLSVDSLKLCIGAQKTIMYSDEIGKHMGQLLNKRMGHSVINNCLPGANLHDIMQLVTKCKFDNKTNLVIWVGNRGNVNKSELIKYIDSLCSLNLNSVVMLTFPYSKSLPQAENDIRYKLNMTLHTISCNNNFIHVIDSNNIVNKNFFLTKGSYYLSNFDKRQVAVSLSYYFSITAKNLANKSASIEQHHDIQNMTLELCPSHLN